MPLPSVESQILRVDGELELKLVVGKRQEAFEELGPPRVGNVTWCT
jgi:hypothetical protein